MQDATVSRLPHRTLEVIAGSWWRANSNLPPEQ